MWPIAQKAHIACRGSWILDCLDGLLAGKPERKKLLYIHQHSGSQYAVWYAAKVPIVPINGAYHSA